MVASACAREYLMRDCVQCVHGWRCGSGSAAVDRAKKTELKMMKICANASNFTNFRRCAASVGAARSPPRKNAFSQSKKCEKCHPDIFSENKPAGSSFM